MNEKFTALLEKCKAYFTKEGLPFNVSVNETKVKLDNLILFCKDKTTKLIEKFEELMLIDGTTKVTIEPSVEVGSAMAIYDAEGNPIPIPANEKPYELQDGRMVMIEQDGIIASIVDPVAQSDEPTSKPEEGASANQVKEMIERIETVSRYAKEVEAKFDAYKADQEKKYNALTEKFEASMKFNKEAFETLLSEPEKQAVNPVVTPFKSQKPEVKSEGMFDKYLIKS